MGMLTREITMPPTSKTEALKAHIKAQVQSGAWPAGHQLPSRTQLMAEHGVSLTVVRDAQKGLAYEGWLVSVPSVGWFVVDDPPIDTTV